MGLVNNNGTRNRVDLSSHREESNIRDYPLVKTQGQTAWGIYTKVHCCPLDNSRSRWLIESVAQSDIAHSVVATAQSQSTGH